MRTQVPFAQVGRKLILAETLNNLANSTRVETHSTRYAYWVRVRVRVQVKEAERKRASAARTGWYGRAGTVAVAGTNAGNVFTG